MDLLNQAQGMEESLKAFIERGAIISKEEMSNIKRLKWMPSTSWIWGMQISVYRRINPVLVFLD